EGRGEWGGGGHGPGHPGRGLAAPVRAIFHHQGRRKGNRTWIGGLDALALVDGRAVDRRQPRERRSEIHGKRSCGMKVTVILSLLERWEDGIPALATRMGTFRSILIAACETAGRHARSVFF